MTAFDFVMDTIRQFGWSIFDIQDKTARASAMAAFVARGADAWKAGDLMFTPQTSPAAYVSLSAHSRSWRGDEMPMPTETHAKKGEGEGGKILYHFPILTQTDDGKTQIGFESTDDEKAFKSGTSGFEKAFADIVGNYDNSMNALKTQAAKGEAADNIARGLLMGNLKVVMPKLSPESEKRYSGMDLESLAGIVGDLAANGPAGAGDGGAGEGAGSVAQSSQASQVTHSKEGSEGSGQEGHTAIHLQDPGQKKKKGMSFKEAAARLEKEAGIKI